MGRYLAGAFFCSLFAVSVYGQTLTPLRAVSISHDITNESIRYCYGSLMVYQRTVLKVSSYKDDALETAADISLPGVSSAWINDVTCSPAGVLAAELTVVDPTLGYAGVIVWIDKSGKTLRVVRLANFGARRIAFGSDGTLWALGRGHDANYDDLPAYDMLRHYDSNGVFMGSALPKASLLAGSPPPHPGNGLLAINGDLILVYFERAHVFAELTTAGKLVGQWRIDPFPEIMLTGTAIEGSGEIYASAMAGLRTSRPYAVVYKLDKQSSRFTPADISSLTPNGESVGLLGNDTDRLVFYTSPPRNLHWASIQ